MAEQGLTGNEHDRARLVRYFGRYGDELEQIRELLQIRLDQLALAYCRRHRLPREAVAVTTRVKTLNSVLNKLARRGWPPFEHPLDAITDLIGARVVCWFVDDCLGMLRFIASSKHLTFQSDTEDYIHHPKKTGYRALHLLAQVSYDSVSGTQTDARIESAQMLCEIQIRSKLQDAWGDITHEFHYKAKAQGVRDSAYEKVLAGIASQLAEEDQRLMKIRDAYQALAASKRL
ncbi:GTP pyrophosphokinase family protein [Ferrimonas balearica]|uniref:GTP pyrophosphokinase n=1 Tax=Ferrimonas balearica TaxID=44012 RepID=UPI001C98F7C7|nr:GTP pyrophosphokinase [Ferrimonas balearica]MBY5991730.1 GTP pyrophosphokinase [Ferrimonas balearica]